MPLTILGSIQDGLIGDYNLLAIKSMLDGFAALAFSSTLGIGVAFAALTVFVFQGALSLGATILGSALGAVTASKTARIETVTSVSISVMPCARNLQFAAVHKPAALVDFVI